ncbi:putative L,D-transpeptidase YkuD [Desulfosporosinus acididurans]|uniref:Putative L,D-transpeptidase YkuD n=1 Tax=Desulfosporosinus acididurans TaxID=476652 RepID=A0A0J1FPQ7_9FIRM|nr:L,D-transpeptidase [Desulfosporosinus acididurans]KLU65470.1 putative L,D-transpeptidase YkuD [Desulfosporosinus acididurans]
MESISRFKIKDNLIPISYGYFLAKSDPLFWRKLLKRKPEDAEAMYHVALEIEGNAKKSLGKFLRTRNEGCLAAYRKGIKEASDLMQRSLGKGYYKARTEILRIQEEIHSTDKRLSSVKKKIMPNNRTLIYVFLAVIIVLLILIAILICHRSSTMYLENHRYTYMLPYEVVDKKPTGIPKTDLIPITIQVKGTITKQLLVNQLMETLKQDYEKNPTAGKLVVAKDEDQRDVGMAYWGSEDKEIEVYIYPFDSISSAGEENCQLWQATTVIRSALYQFVKHNGYMPKDLTMLTKAFPRNYLSELPLNPYNMENDVTTSPSGDAGWLFSPSGVSPETDLILAVRQALKPAIPQGIDFSFAPIQININKLNHELMVMAGDRTIRSYTVALGKNNLTPEGNMWISKRIANPDKGVPKADNVYGTRAMELSNPGFAIHGTNSPESIGKDVSLGCIRLNNLQMEDLYTLTPLYTYVNIFKNPNLPNTQINPPALCLGPNGQPDYSKEESLTFYHWGG